MDPLLTVTFDAGASRSDTGMVDRALIRELLENWVLWRDAGEWERFATLWHDEGRMIATWFQAGAADFIAGSRRAFESGVVVLHVLGGSSIDIHGNRALSQTKMQIIQHGRIDDVDVDVHCYGRFVDALEKRDGRWGLMQRQPMYELDQISTARPGQSPDIGSNAAGSVPFRVPSPCLSSDEDGLRRLAVAARYARPGGGGAQGAVAAMARRKRSVVPGRLRR